MYEIDDKDYCYLGTDVLKNKFDIRDKTKLDAVERDLTALRIKELVSNPDLIKSSFDLDHLQKLHKYMFQDVFDWAGSLRTIRISKGIMFAYPENIKSEANKYFKMLKSENHLKKLPIDKFCDRLAFYKTEVNMLHPFREGNGRVIREFMRTLAYNSGYQLNFPLTKDDYFKAMIQSPNDTEPLKIFFRNNITKLEIINIKDKVIRQYEHEFPAIKNISDKTAQAIDTINKQSSSMLSIKEIKQAYKEAGKRLEQSNSKEDKQEFKVFRDIVDDLKQAQLTERNQQAQEKVTDKQLKANIKNMEIID